MAAPRTVAVARRLPVLAVRGVATAADLPLRHGAEGAIVAASAGTWTLKTRAGEELAAGACTVSAGIASASITAPTTADYGEGYELHWSLTVDAATWPYREPAYIVRWVPPCAVSAADLYTVVPELRHRIPADQRTAGTGWQPQIDLAYADLIGRMTASGIRCWEVIGIDGYQTWLRERAVQLAVGAVPVGIDGAWKEQQVAAHYRMKTAEAQMSLQLDSSASAAQRGPGVGGVIRLCPARRPLWVY